MLSWQRSVKQIFHFHSSFTHSSRRPPPQLAPLYSSSLPQVRLCPPSLSSVSVLCLSTAEPLPSFIKAPFPSPSTQILLFQLFLLMQPLASLPFEVFFYFLFFKAAQHNKVVFPHGDTEGEWEKEADSDGQSHSHSDL